MVPCRNPRGTASTVCAGYAPYIYMLFGGIFRRICAGVCAGHIRQDIAGKIGSAVAPPSVRKGGCARKALTEDFGICAGYAPD